MNKRIKELRNVLGMSQAEFASNLNLGQTAVSSMERGASPVMDRTISQLVTVFGVSETWLRTGNGDMFPAPSDEDTGLMEIMARLTSDSSSPEQKRFVIAAARASMNMSAIALKGGTALFEELYNSLKCTEKDED